MGTLVMHVFELDTPDVTVTFTLAEWAEVVAHLGYGNDPEAIAYGFRIRDAVATALGEQVV